MIFKQILRLRLLHCSCHWYNIPISYCREWKQDLIDHGFTIQPVDLSPEARKVLMNYFGLWGFDETVLRKEMLRYDRVLVAVEGDRWVIVSCNVDGKNPQELDLETCGERECRIAISYPPGAHGLFSLVSESEIETVKRLRHICEQSGGQLIQ